MQYKPPGRHRTVADFREHFRGLNPAFDCDEELLGAAGPLGQPLDLGHRQLANRFATQPMEGWDASGDGRPTELTLRRWRRFGTSGAKLIWGGEAFAVQADGRANPKQLYLNPNVDIGGDLERLVAEVRAGHRERELDADDLYIGLQLTHSGRFARPEGPLAPRITYHHPPLEEKYAVDGSITALTDGELEAIGDNYVLAAEAAERAGFDFVDVKCCHGYLLHELLGAHRREGDYGGSFDNRTRLFRRIVSGIRSRCTKLDVGVRVSLVDVFPHSANPETRVGEPADWQRHVPYDLGFGVDPDDPRRFDFRDGLRFLGLVESLGIRLVNLTLGSPYYCPHLQRPAAYPPSDGYLPPEDPLLGVMAHLDCARRAKAAFPGLVIVGTGYSYLQEYLPHVAQYEVGQGHVDVVGLGRMALVYPDLAQDVLDGKTLEKRRICRTFSDCTTAPRNGMVSGCYPLDLHYKNSPEAKRLKLIKKEQR